MTSPSAWPLDPSATFYVAGHTGLVGSAIVRHLRDRGHTDVVGRSSAGLDLRDRESTFGFFAETRPRYVVVAAARVGGILANAQHPVGFLSDNLRIQTNVLDAALAHEVERLLFLGSSCIYPKHAAQPIVEDALLTGPLEPTNDAYAVAKIAGIHQVQAVRREFGLPWIAAMPTNLYGPGDNFSPTTSHVLPAMIRRFDDAVAHGTDRVVNWGSGSPRREFLHVDDLADACLFLVENYDADQHINVGWGQDVSIRELSQMVADVVGFDGDVEWDTSRPDGTPRKVLDVTRLTSLGWRPRITLDVGLRSTYSWYRDHALAVRR